MFRFLAYLIGRPYEECKGCEVLKQQLQISNERNEELTKTLLDIIHPKPPTINGPVEQPISLPVATTFTRRRAALEEKDRLAAKTIRESKNIGMPDNILTRDIEKLEKELGVIEEEPVG